MMLAPGPARKVIIHLNEDVSSTRDFLHCEILEFLYAKGVAGASVIRPIAGFGAHHQIHTVGAGSVEGEHLPLRIEFLETDEKVDRILPELCALINDGLVEMHPTTVIKSARGTETI